MAELVQRSEAALGRGVTGWATAGVALGAVALLAGFLVGSPMVPLGVLAASWLFFAGVAAGGVAFSAAVRCSKGRWAGAALPTLEAGAAFFPAALALLAVLVLGARAWIPGAAEAGWGPWASRAVRELGASAVLFAVGTRYLKRARAESEPAPSRAAVAYLLLYVSVLSMWAIDLVMDLHEWAPSTVIPVYYFIGALLGAIALAALPVGLGPETAAGAAVRPDLGKLLFAMVIFWGYLLWAAYLPVWYGNMPDETGQLLARWVGGWKILSLGVLATVLGFPFFFLLSERTKRGRASLAVVATGILAGLFGEHLLLVLPSLPARADAPSVILGALVAVGMLGLFLVAVGARLGALPRTNGLAGGRDRFRGTPR
jgi:hypothetical protein